MMRILLIAAGLFLLSGCQQGHVTGSHGSSPLAESGETSNMFPEFLVGTWEADNARWVFNFEPDGSISSFRHFVGMEFDVNEGGLTEELRGGVIATYVLGPCKAVYVPKTRQLDVTVIVELFNIGSYDDRIEGNFVDYLRGPVSQDGKRWKVNWLSYCTTEGAVPPDPNKIKPTPLTFTKVLNEVKDENQ